MLSNDIEKYEFFSALGIREFIKNIDKKNLEERQTIDPVITSIVSFVVMGNVYNVK